MDPKQSQTATLDNKESGANAPADPPVDVQAENEAGEDTRANSDSGANASYGSNSGSAAAAAAEGEQDHPSRTPLDIFGSLTAASLAVSAFRQSKKQTAEKTGK